MAEIKLGEWAMAEEDCTQAIALAPSYVKVCIYFQSVSAQERIYS